MKIKITLNGEDKIIEKEKTISGLLEDYQLSPHIVAVELNFKIIKRDAYGSTKINDGDKIEIVRMMGGG